MGKTTYASARSSQYRARQGYTDTLRHVVLTRVDNDYKTYEPNEEAYQIPDISWDLEGDRHTVSTLGTLVIRLLRTAELVDYLNGLTVPEMLRIDVSCYHLFHDEEKYWLWSGVLRELPGGESVYPADKITLTFIAAPAQWPDADDVKDAVTGAWYENKHVTDTVLPALLEEAFKGLSGRADLEAPSVYNPAPFFSSIDRPRKNLAAPAMPYDATCRVSGMAWDSTRSLLYVGVHDAQGSASLPWLVSYDPETRVWKRVSRFAYKGSKWQLKWPTEWEIAYLEYSPRVLYGVARTNFPDLLKSRAHEHSRLFIYPGFAKFLRSAPITITTGTALTTDKTIQLPLAGLTFDTADYSDCAVGYWNGTSWEEIDRDVRNLGHGIAVMFRLQAGIGAATTNNTSYRIFWRGLGRATKTNRDNVYLNGAWDDCDTKDDFDEISGVWGVVGGRLISPAGNRHRIVKDVAVGTADVAVYVIVNRAAGNNAGIFARANPGTGQGWYAQLGAGNFIVRGWDTGAAVILAGNVAYVHDNTVDHYVLYRGVANNHEIYTSPVGTDLPGAAQLAWAHANGNANEYNGFMARNSANNESDQIYQIAAVAVEPSCALGDIEKINGIYDDYLFPLHDRGLKIRTRYVQYDNRLPDGTPPAGGGVDYYGDMDMFAAGWGTPRHEVKSCGTFSMSGRYPVVTVSWGVYGGYKIRISLFLAHYIKPVVGMRVEIRDTGYGYRQDLGQVMAVDRRNGEYVLSVEYPVLFRHIGGLGSTPKTMLFPAENLPGENIFIGEPQEVSVEGIYPATMLPDPTPIYAERRREADASENFYWPRDIASAEIDEKVPVDEPGYFAFSTVRELENYAQDDPVTYMKYLAGMPLQFDINLKGYRPAYSLVDGLFISSPVQRRLHERPGKVGLYRTGIGTGAVRTSEDQVLETYGNIFLSRDGGIVYVAWNEHRQDEYGAWYNCCCQGHWTGTRVNVDFRDRSGPKWRNSPERYITAYAHHKGKSYFGLRRYDRRWVDLGLKIFYAAPPQTDSSPRGYDGGYACLGAVKGNKEDVLESGSVVRLGPYNNPGRQEWRIMDVASGSRQFRIGIPPWSTSYLAEGEATGIFTITWFTLLALNSIPPGPDAYNAAVGREVRGKYITIAAGRDERAEIAVL